VTGHKAREIYYGLAEYVWQCTWVFGAVLRIIVQAVHLFVKNLFGMLKVFLECCS